MTIRILITLGTLLLLSALAVGQDRKTPSPALVSIDSYAKQVDQFIKRNRKRRRTFGSVAEDQTDRWREFKGKPAKGEADPDDLDEVAYVWVKAGRVVAAGFAFQSGSRDWAHFVTYYFREDGTLAKIHAQLNTFYGDLSVVRDRFYSSGGKLLRTSTRYLDLQSQKPRKRGDFTDEPIPVYLRVRDLPFSKLL